MGWLLAAFEGLHGAVFEGGVLPVVYALGLMRFAEDAYAATGWALLGVLEIGVVWPVLRPMEAWRPFEAWANRRALRADVLYTVIERVGVVALLFFFTLRPLVEELDGALRFAGYIPPQIEDLLPGLREHPLAAFLVYLVALDLSEYVRHRLQHRFGWWWALHAVHHSQRQLSFWSDDRNHVADSLIAEFWRALVALVIGVPGGQFLLIVLITRGIESLAHANARVAFGAMGDRLLVSPRYHRIHHGIGVGHEGPARGVNFAALFPIWDIAFRTADWSRAVPPTGIRDQLDGADYGRGFWSQQWKGFARLARAMAPSG